MTALVAMLPFAATAATITSSASLASQAGTSATLSLDRFKPSLGTLTGVNLSFSGLYSLNYRLLVECGGAPCEFGTSIFASLTGSTIGPASAEDVQGFGGGCEAGPYEDCSFSINASVALYYKTAFTGSAKVASFIGSTPFDVNFNGDDSYAGDVAYVSGRMLTGLNASVTYTYDPAVAAVPLPAGMPLLAGAIGGLGLIRRRRRS